MEKILIQKLHDELKEIGKDVNEIKVKVFVDANTVTHMKKHTETLETRLEEIEKYPSMLAKTIIVSIGSAILGVITQWLLK